MTLKESMAADISTFLNLDEFAELHTLNNKEVACIIDKDSSKTKSLQDGVWIDSAVVYVKFSDYGKRPAIGSLLVVDTKRHIVVGLNENNGILEITIEANES